MDDEIDFEKCTDPLMIILNSLELIKLQYDGWWNQGLPKSHRQICTKNRTFIQRVEIKTQNLQLAYSIFIINKE